MAESFTNQAREQAESKSSFFKREKLLSGFRSKRSRITGAKFKKGTSQESSDNIEARISANEKKITLLKNIIKLRKENVDKQLKPEDNQQQMGSPLLESLQSIASTVDSIRNTLIQQQDNDKGVAESMRREREEKDRQSQEKKLEKPKLLQKFADPIIKPVMSLWDRIFGFLKTLFLGKILMNFIDWFANPANQGKIQTLVRFVKDWWPALTAAVLLFGTGFGGLVAGLIKTIMWFIPAMGKAIAFMKSAKFMSMIPGGGKIGAIAKVVAPLAIAGGVGYGIGRMQGGDDQQEPLQMNKGGTVPGSGNKDTVPAMLTPGEFVMSKGAVQEYGVEHLEGMNAAAGGTNIPTLKKVEVPHYEGGGPVMGYGMGEIMPDQFVFNKTEFKKKITTRERNGEIVDHNVEKSFTDIGGSIGMPDLKEHQTQLVESLRQVPGYEDINFMDVVQYPDGQGRLVDMPEETLYPILNASDAAKATNAKINAAHQQFMEDNDLIKPDGSVKGYSYFDGKLKVEGEEERDAVLATGAIREFNGGGLVPHFMGGGIVNNAATQSMGMEGGVFNNMFNNTLGYQGGGLVQGLQGGGQPMTQERANAMAEAFDNRPSAQLQKLRNERDAMDFGPDGKLSRKDRKRWNEIGAEIHAIQSQIIASQGGTSTPTQIPVNSKKKGGGLMEGIKRAAGGYADFMTGGIFDFDKKNPEGSPKGFGPARMMGGIVDHMTMGLTDFDKRGAGNFQFNPIGGGDNKKWDIGPKEKPKNTVVAYEQAVNEQQQQNQQGEVDGNEIPSFTLRPDFMIDEAKVDVLGIVV